MADQENFVRVTRLAAKRRAAQESSAAGESKRTRVVLGEIQNVLTSDVGVLRKNRKVGVKNKKKSKAKRNVKRGKAGETKSSKKETDPGIDLDGKSDDPQMCEAYVSDIYEYLHNSEVSINWIYWPFWEFIGHWFCLC